MERRCRPRRPPGRAAGCTRCSLLRMHRAASGRTSPWRERSRPARPPADRAAWRRSPAVSCGPRYSEAIEPIWISRRARGRRAGDDFRAADHGVAHLRPRRAAAAMREVDHAPVPHRSPRRPHPRRAGRRACSVTASSSKIAGRLRTERAITATRAPSATKRRTTCVPMKPVPPRIATSHAASAFAALAEQRAALGGMRRCPCARRCPPASRRTLRRSAAAMPASSAA